MDPRRIDLLFRFEASPLGPIEECWCTVHDYGELVALFSVPIGPFDTYADLQWEASRRCEEVPFEARLPLT